MIEPEAKSEIRNCIVRANLALHRGETDHLTEQLAEALAVAQRIRQEHPQGTNAEQPRLF